ncbi:MAG TPA: peptidase dimerization domain-containing protein [Gemmatimonadaceae bacterium]|nr:peptidase dimerization domain-containing protein [Gemmatimonadaceae bacterium]
MRIPICLLLASATLPFATAHAQDAVRSDTAPAFTTTLPADDARAARLKSEATARVDSMAKLTQEIVDMVFSFGELGYQETETARYLTALLERRGFRVTRGYAGMPTAWVATWGSGKPVIAIGSDVDGIPKASQKPGVAYRDAMIDGAPGHGEGHNAGQAVNITAALALKAIMEREKLPGTLILWPGVAEELVGAKAYFVRQGLFRDADVALFSHVSSNLSTAWGGASGNGLVSVEYTFQGTSAHSAGAPWRGRSALDAVELMNVAWNYRREHMRIQQRSHHVITNGGDQPNVVPQVASVWYYFRETDAPRIREMWAVGDTIARAAAMMTGTTLASSRVLGAAWPQHFNKPVAEAMQANIARVGLPQWSEADQTLARALQCEMSIPQRGLASRVGALEDPIADAQKRGGGSDDIGDVTWTVPTVTLRFPSNIPGIPGHNWTDAIAMATPIAHKGATAGAKVMALTLVDLLTKPTIITQAWDYFRTVQTKDMQYAPFIRPQDTPAIELNSQIMAQFRPEMRKFYYDPSRHASYLEQLGIAYPTVRPCGTATDDN